MDQVNIHTTPPADQPPRPPSRWPLYAFIALVAIVVIAAVAIAALRHAAPQAAAHATVTPTAISRATPTVGGTAARLSTTPQTGSSATPASALAATATPSTSASTPTALSAGTPTTAPTATPVATTRPPTNPTALHVASGSCTVHRITWTWSGAQRAISYNVVVYNPQSGATVTSATTTAPRYILPAGPGATVALKVRSRNTAGAAPGYFTPGSVGRVPALTSNPISMTNSTSDHTLTWFWTGARHATAYDIVLYHYTGSTAKMDITARTRQAHWATAVTPGVTYYLKVRSVGACAPTTFYSPARPATVGATPTPGP